MDYLARIELDGQPREGDRAKLDKELAKSDFYFIIMGSDGVTGFQLPSGTYHFHGGLLFLCLHGNRDGVSRA